MYMVCVQMRSMSINDFTVGSLCAGYFVFTGNVVLEQMVQKGITILRVIHGWETGIPL